MDDVITCFYEIVELLKLHVDEIPYPEIPHTAVLGCADGSEILMGWDDTFAETAHKILDRGGLVSATWRRNTHGAPQ